VAVAHKQKKKFILHMDNSPMHKAKVVKAKLSQMPIHLAPHPPYSPHLASSDFFLFGYLKEKSLGLEFESPEALLAWINAKTYRESDENATFSDPFVTGISSSPVTEIRRRKVNTILLRLIDPAKRAALASWRPIPPQGSQYPTAP
jgi:hypothetical protein